MSSETITRNDLTNILNEIVAIDGTDMTAQEVDDFVDSLNVSSVNLSNPIKMQTFGWVASSAYNAGSLIASTFSVSNASQGTPPDGYTFVSWVYFWTSGWVGSIYTDTPLKDTNISIWTATAKSSTSGVSLNGLALYVKDEYLSL